MDINELLLNVQEAIELFENCEKCKTKCDKQHKINLCGHIYCDNCISSIENCVKCGIKFIPKDVLIDRKEKDNQIIKQLTDLHQLLGSKISNVSQSTMTINETDHCNIIDNYSKCECVDYCEVDQKLTRNETENKKNAVGETKLFHACKKAQENEVDKLLQSGASVNVQDYAGWTPLHEAVYGRNLNIAERLLKSGCVVNVPGDMYDTPLHKAIESNNIEMALLLIKYGADINLRNYKGKTPMDIAPVAFKDTLKNAKAERRMFKIPECKQQYFFYILGPRETDTIDVINQFNIELVATHNSNVINENVTHVIATYNSKLLEPCYDLLLAITHQIPVISIEWLKTCVTLNKIVDYTEYFIVGTNDYVCDVINKSQINKHKMYPKLFNGCYFYLANPPTKTCYKLNNKPISREQLVKLITAAGGTILKREPHLATITSHLNHYPWHAQPGSLIEQCCYYIVYVPAPLNESRQEIKYNMKELRHVPYTWLFDCILQYKLVNPSVEYLQ